MQIAVHVLAYDVNRYINAMLRNVAPHVDKIYIAYPKRPFNYIPSSRETRSNPTKLEDINLGGFKHKVEIIQGDWAREEDTRNECFSRAKAEGFDWLIIQDADEFYTEESWAQIRKQLEVQSGCELFKTTWFNFWKTSEFAIVDHRGSIKETNAGFAIRCKQNLMFTHSRTTNFQKVRILDCPCYHYGYVKTDQEMMEKVTQWSHADQFNGPRWYEIKWKNWTLDTVNLHPTNPTAWKRAIRFPLHQPNFSSEFADPFQLPQRLNLNVQIRDFIYDTHAEARYTLSRLKKAILK